MARRNTRLQSSPISCNLATCSPFKHPAGAAGENHDEGISSKAHRRSCARCRTVKSSPGYLECECRFLQNADPSHVSRVESGRPHDGAVSYTHLTLPTSDLV